MFVSETRKSICGTIIQLFLLKINNFLYVKLLTIERFRFRKALLEGSIPNVQKTQARYIEKIGMLPYWKSIYLRENQPESQLLFLSVNHP